MQSLALLLVVTILLLGLIAAWPTVKDAVISELVDTGGAVDSLNQSYSYAGLEGSTTAGSSWQDEFDAGQTQDPPGDFGRGVGFLPPANECVDCDDGIFCNGAEVCDGSTGLCVSGPPPCAAGETCNESTGMCESAPLCQDAFCGCVPAFFNPSFSLVCLATCPNDPSLVGWPPEGFVTRPCGHPTSTSIINSVFGPAVAAACGPGWSWDTSCEP